MARWPGSGFQQCWGATEWVVFEMRGLWIGGGIILRLVLGARWHDGKRYCRAGRGLHFACVAARGIKE
ncbi:hypothetical protein CBR_g58791 [Chara braunii]|uniref:Uncharacterized protein n=1 Tax=Chara braunii TaxID=69332 RepID=A0A388K8C7_CHABU|nr:hypothetical protein CBR_g58791 [Chara braunii]|eukprot:GBG66300.1 hypothetical protein CBR_g58791 [Chara braunii]